MKSMTGFGRGTSKVGFHLLTVEIKSVNHRFLELRTRTPSEITGIDSKVEQLIRKQLSRGYCTININLESLNGIANPINVDLLEQYIMQLKTVAKKTNTDINCLTPILSQCSSLFDCHNHKNDNLQEATILACTEAINNLLCMRDKEGSFMKIDISDQLKKLSDLTTKMNLYKDNQKKILQDKFTKRIKILLEPQITPDNNRIETEAALFADKADITEEVSRIKSHIDQFSNLLGETLPIGRKMEFLLQEIGREVNTIGSKSGVSQLTHLVINFKSELEKIREIAANVE